MTRQYKFRQLMIMLTNKNVFVMRDGDRFFFAQIAE